MMALLMLSKTSYIDKDAVTVIILLYLITDNKQDGYDDVDQ